MFTISIEPAHPIQPCADHCFWALLLHRPRPGPAGGFTAPLTRVVCTPCYRAPEVVMSRGGYTSAIDMWSVGCVFGELLQRAIYIGHASTPQLQVGAWGAATEKQLNHGQFCTEVSKLKYRQFASCSVSSRAAA